MVDVLQPETDQQEAPVSSFLDLGEAATDEVSSKPEEDQESREPEVRHKANPQKYANQPVISDQFIRFPETVRYKNWKASTFNLGDESDLEKYNAILSKSTDCPEAPLLVIEKKETHFHEGTFYALVEYAEIHYPQFLDQTDLTEGTTQ